MDDKKNKKREFLDIGRLTSVGIGLVLCTMIGFFIGNAIDKHFHTRPVFMLVFLLLGIAAGMMNIFRTLDKNGN